MSGRMSHRMGLCVWGRRAFFGFWRWGILLLRSRSELFIAFGSSRAANSLDLRTFFHTMTYLIYLRVLAFHYYEESDSDANSSTKIVASLGSPAPSGWHHCCSHYASDPEKPAASPSTSSSRTQSHASAQSFPSTAGPSFQVLSIFFQAKSISFLFSILGCSQLFPNSYSNWTDLQIIWSERLRFYFDRRVILGRLWELTPEDLRIVRALGYGVSGCHFQYQGLSSTAPSFSSSRRDHFFLIKVLRSGLPAI